jgi:hypothetical protein
VLFLRQGKVFILQPKEGSLAKHPVLILLKGHSGVHMGLTIIQRRMSPWLTCLYKSEEYVLDMNYLP